MNARLEHRHRDTLEKLFAHPTSANIEWRQVLSLLEAAGGTVEEHGRKVEVRLGGQIAFLDAPHGKDVDRQLIVDVRRLLTAAGFGPEGSTHGSPGEAV
jgi:hypothetical protein